MKKVACALEDDDINIDLYIEVVERKKLINILSVKHLRYDRFK